MADKPVLYPVDYDRLVAERDEALDAIASLPLRKHGDGLNDLVSLATGLVCPPEEDKTRQEDKVDADINVILRRGGLLPPGRPTVLTETDFDVDLLTAMQSFEDARQVFFGMPLSSEARRYYPTFELFLDGIRSGNIVFEAVPPVVPPVPEA